MSEFDPPKGTIPAVVKWGAVIAIAITVLYVFLMPLIVGGKVVDRAAQKYDAETSLQTYEGSRAFIEGKQKDINRYCVDIDKQDGAARTAVINLLRDTVSSYTGPLTAANKQCLTKNSIAFDAATQ